MCVVLGVTRQAISSYVIGRTTPKPHIVRRLLCKWPVEISYRDIVFGPEAFNVPDAKPESVPLQGNLFAALSSIKREDLKIDVDRSGWSDVELKVSIKIAG
jgi:hypothetical protein